MLGLQFNSNETHILLLICTPSFDSSSQLSSEDFPGSFASAIYVSRATGNEAELTKRMEVWETFCYIFLDPSTQISSRVF